MRIVMVQAGLHAEFAPRALAPYIGPATSRAFQSAASRFGVMQIDSRPQPKRHFFWHRPLEQAA